MERASEEAAGQGQAGDAVTVGGGGRHGKESVSHPGKLVTGGVPLRGEVGAVNTHLGGICL